MSSHVSVGCFCLTYGRPELLAESVECFLRQDYSGPAELLVVNDLATQTLECDAPGVTVVNLPVRFRCHGAKVNAAIGLLDCDLVLPWSDDDVHMPWRVAQAVDAIEGGGFDFWKPARCWYEHRAGQPLDCSSRTRATGQSVFRWDLWRAVGGFGLADRRHDLAFERACHALVGPAFRVEGLYPERLPQVIRLDTSWPHLAGRPTGWADAADWAARHAERGQIRIEPRWSCDWVARVLNAAARVEG